MAKIYGNAADTIGNTPIAELSGIEKKYNLPAKLLAKLEFFNPTGSAKDRIAKEMIEDAEHSGKLQPGAVIIEPTSGNTGIGLASIAAIKGYRAVFVMPETMSLERINILKAYGAEIVLTEGSKGMAGSIEMAQQLSQEIQGSFIPAQFDNPANAAAHYKTTGPEIWQDTGGMVDILVAGVGTGGTITGAGQYLKEQKPDIQVVAVEPAASPLLSEGISGVHRIQGIGANFVPKVLDTGIYNEVVTVSDEDAVAWAKEAGKTEGILTGISSGAVLKAAVTLAQRPENKGRNIVAVFTDGGDRYYSTELFV